METQTKYPSVIKMKNLVVSDIIFKRNETFTEQKAPVKFERSVMPDGDSLVKVQMKCTIGKEDSEFYLSVTIIGEFEYEPNTSEEQKHRLAHENAVAIISPFLRSQIAVITSQPNMTPIVLQPMNIVAMLQEEQNTKQ